MVSFRIRVQCFMFSFGFAKSKKFSSLVNWIDESNKTSKFGRPGYCCMRSYFFLLWAFSMECYCNDAFRNVTGALMLSMYSNVSLLAMENHSILTDIIGLISQLNSMSRFEHIQWHIHQLTTGVGSERKKKWIIAVCSPLLVWFFASKHEKFIGFQRMGAQNSVRSAPHDAIHFCFNPNVNAKSDNKFNTE